MMHGADGAWRNMDMDSNPSPSPGIDQAITKIQTFVKQTAGIEPSLSEIADALQRYFVLKEIKDHIVMAREQPAREREA